jgi:hypothetical protein
MPTLVRSPTCGANQRKASPTARSPGASSTRESASSPVRPIWAEVRQATGCLYSVDATTIGRLEKWA